MGRSHDALLGLRSELAQTRDSLQSVIEQRDAAERIVDTLREGILVLDDDLCVRSANRSFLERFQLSKESVIGRQLSELGGGEWKDAKLEGALGSVRAGKPLDDFRLERNWVQIGRRVLLLNARRIEPGGAAVPSLLLSVEDVTDAVHTEESALRAMLTAAVEPIVISDLQGKIAFANPAAHQAYGYGDGELLGAPVEILVPERLRSRHVAHRASYGRGLAARPMGRPGMDLLARRKDGTEFPVEVALTPIQWASGPVVVAFVNDIRERKEHERRILTYQDKLRRMAFDSALAEDRERRRIAMGLHDGVGQTLALVQNQLAGARSAAAASIRKTIDRCVQLVEEAIGQTRTLTFDLSPPILYDLGLEPALRWLAEQVEKRYGVHVYLDGDKDMSLEPEVAAIVFRSVRELLTNVAKHAKVDVAQVTLSREGKRAAVTVDDEGAGFEVVEPGAVRPGAGYGLFSIREQIERLGGSMSVRSAPEQGTHVALVVPLSRPPSEPRQKGSGS